MDIYDKIWLKTVVVIDETSCLVLLSGILDSLPEGSSLLGFVGGTGLFAGHSVTITPEVMANYRGQGGFDLLGR